VRGGSLAVQQEEGQEVVEDDWFLGLGEDLVREPPPPTPTDKWKDNERKRRQAQAELEEEEAALRKIRSVRADSLRPRLTYWLWRDRFPLGGISLVAGKGEVSKSTLLTRLGAWLTNGEMKGAFWGTPVDIAYVVNEDELEATVLPRFMVHGADLKRVHFLVVYTPTGEDTLRLPADADRLRAFIRETGVRAVFVDPLSANIQAKVNDPGEMRRVFTEIARICRDMQISIIGLAHTRKAHAEDVVEALMGSVEQVNVSRSVHGLIMDPEDDGVRLLSLEKSNLSDRSKLPTLRFRLESTPVETDDGESYQPMIVWEEEISERASDILGDALHGRSGVDEAARWLFEYLAKHSGEARWHDIREAAPKQMSTDMLKRARKKIGVTSKRLRQVPPVSVWSLPS
jgi:AAA domain-containing protein